MIIEIAVVLGVISIVQLYVIVNLYIKCDNLEQWIDSTYLQIQNTLQEMRDLDTIQLALTAAETGHLVLSTLHTSSAVKTIDRIIDVFPSDSKSYIRSMLSESIVAVIAQKLLKKNTGDGRVPACEIMIANTAIKNLIREDKIYQIPSLIQAGAKEGMQTLDMDLQRLLDQGLILKDDAIKIAENPEVFAKGVF